MKYLIDEYLLKKTEELSFIRLREGAQLKISNYVLPSGGLDFPILTNELAENIKSKSENEIITIGSLVRGIIYLIGIDSTFKHNNEYIKFLYAANPEIEKYILREGFFALEKDDLIKALIFFKALVVLKPNDVKILLNYSIALIQYRDRELVNKKKIYNIFTDEIKDKLEILLNLDSQQALAYYYLGFIYKEKRLYRKAKIHWEKALALELEGSMKEELNDLLIQLEDMVQYEKGYEAVLSENPQEGLILLKELEEKYNDWWNLVFFIGLAYRRLGNFQEGVKYFKKVLTLKKDQPDALAELGLCYAGLGEIQRAIDTLEKVIEIQGQNNEILCNLAMLYLEVGDMIKAEELIDTSLKLNPQDEITLSCKRMLNTMKETKL